MTQRILVTGPFGQIGSQLVPQLQRKYGKQNIVALGHKTIPKDYDGQLEKGDVTDKQRFRQICMKRKITQIYHMAAVLSATGQKEPDVCWNVNLISYKNIFDVAVQLKITKVFCASSMAVFGPTTPKQNTPQHCSIQPTTMYGVTKYAGQMLGAYYYRKFGLDVRSVRYPGIISWKAEPGGGTTDYAVAIFYDCITKGKYTCFVKQQTRLPMMYIDDAIKATIDIMEADVQKIKNRMAYNLAAISFSVKQLADQIRKKRSNLQVDYKPDSRQNIADSWPASIDDSEAREHWGWKHQVDLAKLTEIMLQNLQVKLNPRLSQE